MSNYAANADLRYLIETNGLRYWQVAERIGVTNCTLSTWMRTEMKGVRKMRVEKAINELLDERLVNKDV